MFISSLTFVSAVSLIYGIKVNMQGSVSFGKDVLNTLGMFLKTNEIGSRRSQFSKDTDTLYLLTKYSYICRGLPFCEGELQIFLNEYITLLTKAVETAILTEQTSTVSESSKKHVFEKPLQKLLFDIKKLLRAINAVVNEKNNHYLWKEVIKRISAMFQEKAEDYSTNKLGPDSGVTRLLNKKMIQKIVIATATVESTYEIKLCIDHGICTRSYECTKSLHILFGALETLEMKKMKVFIKHFSNLLLETSFYSYVDENTANDLQISFDEIAYADGIPINKVFHHFNLIVEAILHGLKAKQYFISSKDAELAHVILSDMDHFYKSQKIDPFHVFLRDFFIWIRLDKDIKQPLREVINDITVHINQAAQPLRLKLFREVRVYLELLTEL